MDFSCETIELVVRLKSRLRQHGVKVSLEMKNAPCQLLNISEQIEDDNIQKLRANLLGALPEIHRIYIDSASQESPTCNRCKRVLEPGANPSSQHYLICVCDRLFLLSSQDQRKHPRLPVHLPGIYRVEQERGRFGEMVVKNLSAGGVRLETTAPHSLAPKDQLTLSFTLDDAAQSGVHVSACVLHTEGEVNRVQFDDPLTLDHALTTYLGISWINA